VWSRRQEIICHSRDKAAKQLPQAKFEKILLLRYKYKSILPILVKKGFKFD